MDEVGGVTAGAVSAQELSAPESARGGGSEVARPHRRRRANASGGRHHQHQVKVTPEEEALLQQLAQRQGVTVSRLLVESALASERGETVTERREAIGELFAVHRVLAGVANNMNQVTKRLHGTGELPVETPEVLEVVRVTCARVSAAVDRLAL